MKTDQAALLLKLREKRCDRARKARLLTKRELDRARRQERLAERALGAVERQREQAATRAYKGLVGGARSAAALERLNDDITRLANHCRSASQDLQKWKGRVVECGDADARKLAELRRADADRSTWVAIHDRALAEDLRARSLASDREEEEAVELHIARRS